MLGNLLVCSNDGLNSHYVFELFNVPVHALIVVHKLPLKKEKKKKNLHNIVANYIHV